MIVPLVGLLLVAPFFVGALIIGARAFALSQDAQDDLLFVALALGAAAASIINGMGRHATAEKHTAGKRVDVMNNVRTRGASMIHLGY